MAPQLNLKLPSLDLEFRAFLFPGIPLRFQLAEPVGHLDSGAFRQLFPEVLVCRVYTGQLFQYILWGPAAEPAICFLPRSEMSLAFVAIGASLRELFPGCVEVRCQLFNSSCCALLYPVAQLCSILLQQLAVSLQAMAFPSQLAILRTENLSLLFQF